MALWVLLQERLLRRFVRGRSGRFGALTLTLWALRTVWRRSQRREQLAYRTVLKPGETMMVVHTTDTKASVKAERRAARRAAKRSPSRRAARRASAGTGDV